MLLANLEFGKDLIVSYTDIIYYDYLMADLSTAPEDVSVAIDSAWLERFGGRKTVDIEKSEKVLFAGFKITLLGGAVESESANAEFLGVVKLSANVISYISRIPSEQKFALAQLHLADFIEYLRLAGFSVGFVDVKGAWAELNDPRDIGQFILGTKAETLMRLKNLVKKSIILEQFCF